MASLASIPLELLQKIFYFSCIGVCSNQEVYTVTLGPTDSSLPFQHVLLQVCCHWRDAACSASELWTSIRIYWPRYNPLREEKVRLVVRAAVQYSGTALLDIALKGTAWDEIAYLLLPESHRWRRLQVSNTYSPQQLSDYRTLQDKLPALESLAFAGPVQTRGSAELWKEYLEVMSLMLSNVPSLRSIHGDCDLLFLPFPQWAQITDFKILPGPSIMDPTGLPHWSEGLKYCSSVRRLDIVGLAPQDDTDIFMPSVQELRCSYHPKLWMACLILPRLHTLSIPGIALCNLQVLLERSGCQLTTLAIDVSPDWCSNETNMHDFHTIALRLPRLRSLKVYLQQKSSPRHVVPHLASLLKPVSGNNVFPLLAQFHLELRYKGAIDVAVKMLRSALLVMEGALRPTMQLASVGFEHCRGRGDAPLDATVVLGCAELAMLRERAREEGVPTRLLLIDMPTYDTARHALIDEYLH